MAGLTATGLEILTQAEIQADLEETVSTALGGVDLSGGPEQQIIGVLSEQIAVAWETLQALYGAIGEDANGILLDRIMALTGTKRRAATKSLVTASVNLNAGTTLAAGAQAAVDGNPDAVFETIVDVTNGAGAAADVDVVMRALETGPVAAPAGTLTQIVTPAAGWNSVTNAADASLGKTKAEDPESRQQRRVELAGAGGGTVPGVRAAVAKVDGVVEARCYENTTSVVDADGRPDKSVEAVVWDGTVPAADDDAIAQAIYSKKGGGIEAYGSGSTGTATDELTGQDVDVAFTRATALAPVIVASVILEPGTAAGWDTLAIAAIVARGAEYEVGEDAYASQLICALQEVPGVEAVVSLTLDGGASVAPTYKQIVRIDSGDVTVTEAP